MPKLVAISTSDNPWNPFTNFDEWLMFDLDKGYNSCAYLDRVTYMHDAMTDEEYSAELERAIDEIIRIHGNTSDPDLPHYIKVIG